MTEVSEDTKAYNRQCGVLNKQYYHCTIVEAYSEIIAGPIKKIQFELKLRTLKLIHFLDRCNKYYQTV